MVLYKIRTYVIMYMAIEYVIITDTDNPAIPSCYTVYVRRFIGESNIWRIGW